MKKNLFKYGKKSLSIVMTVLMLMSCWVFIPGEHNHAEAASGSATEAYNIGLLNTINTNVDTNMTTTTGKFLIAGNGDNGGSYNATRSASSYVNVLYSPYLYNTSTPAATFGTVTNADRVAVWYPTTVLMYDGINTPRMGIMLEVDSSSAGALRVISSWMSTGLNGIEFDGSYQAGSNIGNENHWKGYTDNGDSSHMYIMYDDGDRYYASANGTEHSSYKFNVAKGNWGFLGAHLKFTNTLGGSEWVRTITPVWNFWGGKDGSTSKYTGTTHNAIYVMNIKAYKDLLTTINTKKNELISNADQYTPASIQAFVNAAKAVTNLKPKDYVSTSSQNVVSWGSQMTTAYNNYQAAVNGLKKRTYEITYENIFSLSDWYYSQSSNLGNDSYITTDLNAGYTKIYKPSGVNEYTTISSYPNAHNATMYAMDIVGGKDYTIRFDSEPSGNIVSEVFMFWYDAAGNPVKSTSSNNTFDNHSFGSATNCTHSVTFTAPTNAAQAEIRFDNDGDAYSTAYFKNIAVYPAERENQVEVSKWTTRPVRKLYNYNAAIGTAFDTPVRTNYEFKQWLADMNNDGIGETPLSSISSTAMTSSIVVYSEWMPKTIDLGYDNLFSVADWGNAVGDAKTNQGGKITVDAEAGTISIECPANPSSSDNNYVPYTYAVPVTAGTEYVFEYDTNIEAGTGTQIHIFYKTSAEATGYTGFPNSPYVREDGYTTGHTITFTPPEGTTHVSFRFGTMDGTGLTNTFSNIGLYKKEAYDAYAKNYTKVREPFKAGDVKDLMTPPAREGYDFDGWFTAGGEKLTTTEGLTASTTVYAQWTQKLLVTFVDYDGRNLKEQYVSAGGSATAPVEPARDSDENWEYEFAGWDRDFSNVTANITVTATYNEVPHTRLNISLDTPATCLQSGYVYKYCDCGYDWGFVYDEEAYPALGHEFNKDNGATAALGTSSGDKDTDTHGIKCARCDEVKPAAEAHTFNTISASGATCIIPGTVHQTCACGEARDVDGETDPTIHKDTEIRDDKEADCENDGYTGDTWCNDCGRMIKKGETTDKLGHLFTKYESNNDAQCEVDGTKTAVCDRCDATDEQPDVGSALEHEWVMVEDAEYLATAADCVNDATYYYVCDLCDVSSEDKTGDTWTDVGSKWNHNFNGAYVSNGDGTHVQKCTNTDCTATGNEKDCEYGAWTTDDDDTHSHTCKYCNYTPAAEDHDWSAWEEAEGNTGDAAGQMTHYCIVCGKTEITNCDYETKFSAATCTEDAYTTYTCKECDHGYIVREIGSATGHKYTGEYNYNADTDEHQQLCANGCETYGVGSTADAWKACEWSYKNIEAGKHTASCVCGNSEEQACSGGQATCTTLAECAKCGEEYGTTVAHNYSCSDEYLHKATDATCTDNETYYYYCAGCKQTAAGVGTYEKPDSKLPHTYEGKEWYEGAELAKEATCLENAEYYVYCSVCKASSKDTDNEETFEKEGTATDHKWGALVSGNDGTHTYTCQNGTCTETKTENCEDWKIQSGVAPSTCLDQGYTLYECEICAHSWKDNYTDPLGHSYTNKVRVVSEDYKRGDQTCTEPQTYWYRCDRCIVSAETEKDKYDDITVLYWANGEAANHKWANVVAEKYFVSPATCFTLAVYKKSCSVCEIAHETETFTTGTVLSHDWQEVKEDKYLATRADCVNDATYYYVCSLCDNSSKDITGATWEDENSKSGHDFDHDNDGVIGNEGDEGYKAYKAEDCENDGNYEYWLCEVCDKYFGDAEGENELANHIIVHPGHDWVDVSFKAATCEEGGYSDHKDCSRCDATLNKAVYPATGHKFTGAYVFDAANNYHSRKCVNTGCDATGMVDAEGKQVKYTVEYDGLDFVIVGGEECNFAGEYVNETDENGVHSHALKCVCGNETSAVCVDENPETFAPTCIEDGYTEYTCEICDYTWQVAGEPATDHNYENVAWISNGNGTHTRACANACGDKQTEDCSTETPATTCGGKNVCDKCETEYGSEIPHSFTEYVYNNDAKCGIDGTKTAICDSCEEAKDTVKAEGTALTHDMSEYGYDLSGWDGIPEDFDKNSIKAPTCSAEGKQISFCQNEDCDYYKTKSVKKDTSLHVWETDENGEEIWTPGAGSCATGITFVCECTVCGTTKSRVESVEHDWELKVSESATCVEDSCEYFVCKNCGFSKEEHKDAALGHSWEQEGAEQELVVDKDPTCKNPGRGYYVCATCLEKSEYVEIAKIAHDWDLDGDGFTDEDFDLEYYLTNVNSNPNFIYVDAAEADCVNDGYAAHYRCINCSYSQLDDAAWREDNFTAAYGHADNDGDGKCDGKECNKDLSNNNGCGCICHKNNWFMQIIYKIIRFFWKIFGIGKSCDCGFVHY